MKTSSDKILHSVARRVTLHVSTLWINEIKKTVKRILSVAVASVEKNENPIMIPAHNLFKNPKRLIVSYRCAPLEITILYCV